MDRPSSSGVAWPPALRRRLGIPASSSSPAAEADSNDSDSDSDSDSDLEFHLPAARRILPPTSTEASDPSLMSAQQLRKYIRSSYAALTSVQRQLHRGEESYFEETYAHGSLLQGWDNIWIEHPSSGGGSNKGGASSGGVGADLDGSQSSGSGGDNANASIKQPKSIPIKRMPADHRWFSSSCGSILPTGDGNIGALERASLVDRPPTPEVVVKEKTPEKVLVATNDAESTSPENDAKEVKIIGSKFIDDECNNKNHVSSSLPSIPESNSAAEQPQTIQEKQQQHDEQSSAKSTMSATPTSNTPHPADKTKQDEKTKQSPLPIEKKQAPPSPPSASSESKNVDINKATCQSKSGNAPMNNSNQLGIVESVQAVKAISNSASTAAPNAAAKEDAPEINVDENKGNTVMKETSITKQPSSETNRNGKDITKQQQQSSLHEKNQPPPPSYSSLPSTKRPRVELNGEECRSQSKDDDNKEDATGGVAVDVDAGNHDVGAFESPSPIGDDDDDAGGQRRTSSRRKRKAFS